MRLNTANQKPTDRKGNTMATYTSKDLDQRYEKMTLRVEAHCILKTELVGGVKADPDGVRAFVEHHLKLTGEEAEAAIKRILLEEIGEKPVAGPEGAELSERLTYGVNVIRRDEAGPWLGDWQCKACLKAAASRLGLFVSKRGSKGAVAEMGLVKAIGASLMTPDRPERIHLVDDAGKGAQTYFKKFMGRVTLPTGSVSIVNDAECAPVGSRFSFEFRCQSGKLTEDDLVNIFAAACNIGLGSAKAFERGKFSIERLEIE
jgi:hypothetical protein